MATLRIEPARRSKRRWFAIGVVALAVGAALGAILSWAPPTGTDTDAVASAAVAAVRDCCTASTTAASRQAPATTPLAAGPRPADLYREARHYADCLALQEPERQELADGADERYAIDPSGAFAASLIRAGQQQRMACRRVGPYEYRRVEALMNEAATRGNADAHFFQLEHRVTEALAAASALRELDQADSSDPRNAATLAEVEQMALAGYRPAMTLTAQLLTSGLLAPADPQRSAAWQLAATQLEYPQPMTEDQLRGTGLFDELNPEEAQALRRQATALLGRCCTALVAD
ncbi:MAG: hypothetical protein ABJD97_02235 [Betaproteobacteria bacterium]